MHIVNATQSGQHLVPFPVLWQNNLAMEPGGGFISCNVVLDRDQYAFIF